MNPNMYDLMSMMKEDQTPLMLRNLPPELLAQVAPAPQRAPAQAVAQVRAENPNSAQVTPAQMPAKMSLMDILAKRSEDSNNAQRDAIKAIEDQVAASQGGPKQTDWSALAGLTDAWTGSNFSKTYQKPETEAERAQKLLALQTSLLGAKDKITDNDMNMLRAQIQTERDEQRMRHEMGLESLKARSIENQFAKMGQGPKITESERKAALFGSRAADANKYLEDITLKLDPTTVGSAFQQTRFFPEGKKSSEVKQLEQAQRNFLTAVLRKESGAVIGAEELSGGAKQYFPQWGDDEAVLKLKAQNRSRAIEGLTAEGARAAEGFQAAPELYKKQSSASLSAEDQEAYKFVQENPNDPDAMAIKASKGW